MNNAYKNMRGFWLDINNLESKTGLKAEGKDEILIAGLEYCMADNEGKIKNIILAASVLGNASLYFENNSPAGIGGMIGENNEAVKKAALNFIKAGAELTDKMTSSDILPEPKEINKITLFTINKKHTFFITLDEQSARDTKNDFYKFYAYSQQLIGAFRHIDEQAHKQEQAKAN